MNGDRILPDGKHIALAEGGTWPTALHTEDDSLEWRLRYALPEQVVNDRFRAAEIVAAYRALIALPATRRNRVVAAIRAGLSRRG